jgi:hypothetical protein
VRSLFLSSALSPLFTLTALSVLPSLPVRANLPPVDSHTGQFFVDDALNAQVDKVRPPAPSPSCFSSFSRNPSTDSSSHLPQMWPYNLNPIAHKWGRTRNWDDSLGIYQASHANGYGPTFDLEYVGGVIQQGLVGYITVGVNSSASYQPTEVRSVLLPLSLLSLVDTDPPT